MSNPESQYVDYLIAKQIEADRQPDNRAERRRERKLARSRRQRTYPKWVERTLLALYWIVGAYVALALIGWQQGWWTR